MDEILLDEKEITLALKEAWRDVYHSNPDFVQVCTPQTVATGGVVCRVQLRKVVDEYEKKYLFGRSIDDAEDNFALMCRNCSFVTFLQALRAAAEEVRG